MNMMISAALVTLATTGNPAELKDVLGGKIVENKKMDTSVLNEGEHYAPPALVVGNTTYRMVAPTQVTDNFVIKTGNTVVRLDVGKSEGDNVLRVVATSRDGTAYQSTGDDWWSRLKGKLGFGDK